MRTHRKNKKDLPKTKLGYFKCVYCSNQWTGQVPEWSDYQWDICKDHPASRVERDIEYWCKALKTK